MNFGAVILAGGKSLRMGRDKARLEFGGQSLLARQIQVARDAGAAEILISGRAEENYSEFGCRILRDRFVDAGALAGIERALDATISPVLLVMAVDLPKINAEFLQRLATGCSGNSGAIPRVNGNIEPLAAFYPKSAQPLAENLLRNEHNAAAGFARDCVQSGLARFMELSAGDAKFFTNLNSPADLASVVENS